MSATHRPPRLPGSLPQALADELAGCQVRFIGRAETARGTHRVSVRFAELLGCEVDVAIGMTANNHVPVPLTIRASANDALASLYDLCAPGDRYWVSASIAQCAREQFRLDLKAAR